MERRWLLTLACLAGCDEILGITHVDPIALPDATLPVDHCSSTSIIREEFDTKPTFFPALSGSGGNVGVINNGKLQVVMANTGYSIVDGVWFYDMRDDQLTYELSDDNVDPGNSMEIRLDADPMFISYLMFFREGTKLYFQRNDNGTPNRLGEITYAPTEHRFMRFTSLGDDVLFQTSADGTEPFTTQMTAFNVGWLDSARPGVRMTRTGGQYQLLLDSVFGGSSLVGACPARELTDAFDGAALGKMWKGGTIYGGTQTLTNGAVEITSDPNDTGSLNATLVPDRLYDVRGSSVAIEIDQMFGMGSNKRFDFFVRGLGADEAMFTWETQMLRVLVNGSQVMSVPFDATAHRFWRINENAGIVRWEVSANGADYDPLFQRAMSGFERSEIYLHAYGPAMPAATMRIAGINVPAPP